MASGNPGTSFHAMDRRRLLWLCVSAGAVFGLQGPVAQAFGRPSATNAGQRALIFSIADTIIPQTDTAGARGAGVADFIDMIVANWMDEGQRVAFLDGLTAFDAAVRASSGRSFDSLSPQRRETVLRAALIKAQALQKTLNHEGHAPFLVWLKRLTVHGYYTSEIGASQELVLNATPGEYVSCHKMKPGERSFSMDRRHVPFVIDNQVARIK